MRIEERWISPYLSRQTSPIRSPEEYIKETIAFCFKVGSYLSQYYDINFSQTYEIMLEKNYIEEIAYRIPYAQEETAEKAGILVKDLEGYMKGMCRR